MGLKDKVFLLVERLLAHCTDRIVCISKSEEDDALKEHVAPQQELSLIPNGIDIEAVRSAIPIERSKLGIAEDAFVVGMIGRITTQKAPDVFIRAANIIHKEIQNSVFIIVGDGDMQKDVESYAIEHGLKLVITGWTDQPYRYLKDFDVAMLLSRWEGFGLAIVEYMAAEKNLVVTNVDAIPTLVRDHVDGLLTEVNNPQDVADKVLWLYNHPEEAEEMRKNALKKVKEKYDINRVANQHIDMFNKLLEK